MTIGEVCIAARAEGLSYGKYVAKHLNPVRPIKSMPPLKAKKSGLKRDQCCRQYTADGVFVAEFESVAQAAEAMTTNIENLLRALRGDNATCLGYQWRYAFDPTPLKSKRVVCQYTPEGELVGIYPSGHAAESVCAGNINRAIKSGGMAGGYYWKREYRD